MALLLHAITPRSEAITPAKGLHGRALERIDYANLSAWVTELGRDADPFTRDDLQECHRVVTSVFENVDGCLPARFPTWVDDAPTLTELLRKRERQLTSQLTEVSGCCELAVTALWTTSESETVSSAATPGRRYLLERRQALAGSDRRRALARDLADEIERLAADDLVRSERQVCPSPNVALSEALLVKLTAASDLIGRLRRDHEVVRILVNGPWPPYTFAAVRSD